MQVPGGSDHGDVAEATAIFLKARQSVPSHDALMPPIPLCRDSLPGRATDRSAGLETERG